MSRRISYVLPAPDAPLPLLSLPALTEPRLGRTSPLLLQRSAGQPTKSSRRNISSLKDSTLNSDGSSHPRHSLGVAAIALDTSTQLAGQSTPQGILYTGGRDGLVAGWELGLPMTKRRRPRWNETSRPGERVKWERLELGESGVSSTGGWGGENEDGDVDEVDSDLDQDDESYDGNSSDGHADQTLFDDTGGNQKVSSGRGTSSRRRELEYTERWQLDKDALESRPPQATTFRQSVQTHTDWVNDILLCNQNQTVISCSSDRTIRAWAPHDQEKSASPDLIGIHKDYAKVISFSKHTNTLFSGGLDRQIHLWDVAQPRPDEPISTLQFPDLIGGEGGKGSIYALTSNDAGTLVAAGSPERVVRLWDPRAAGSRGGQSIAGLIGHTDNIRAILLSQDGRHLLSASSDSTVKLWSLTAQRCLHTFNHHTDSVWSLYSDHPNFERFLSGDRAGHLAAIDVTGCQNDYSGAECVLLANIDVEEGRRGTEGICQIIGMDDEFVWTATGSASVSRWQDVGRKRDRLEAEVSKSESHENLPGHRPAVEINKQSSAPSAPMVMVNGFIPPRDKNGTPGGGNDSPSQSTNSATSDQRDSRTVAFAEKVEARNPFDDPEDHPAEREPNLASRRLNLPGSNAAASILSVASSQTGATEYPQGRNGIAYSHLVNLSQASALYEHNNVTESQVNAEASGREAFAGSALSLRRSSLGKPAHTGLLSANGTLNPPDAGDVARRDFLEREIVIEADPVRLHPSEVICGRHGLIRALMLNDRQHALTVDTGGQVAVWNVIHGRCVGRFDEHDISGVFQESGYDLRDIAGRGSQEALDIVRERIEGESSTITWCTVDTRIGSLTVHVEENRCFDAEVYADEVGYKGDPAFKEDHRINLGKWALANLFSGLVKAEAEEVAQGTNATETNTESEGTASAISSTTRSAAPTFIALDRATSRRARSQSMLNNGPTTPGALMMGLATPAITPAVLPPAGAGGVVQSHGATASRTHGSRDIASGLPIIPQSPATVASNAATPMSPSSYNTGLRSPKASEAGGPKDYFSIKTTKPIGSDRAAQASTPGASLSSSLPAQTPGGSFMGKFKGFGGKGKKSAGADVAAPVPIAPMPEESEDDASKTPPAPEREVAQLRLLSQIRAHGFQPPPPSEAPRIKLPADVALLISEESKEAGAWAVIYRSMVSRTERDMEPLEMAAPGWVLEYLFAGRNRVKEPVKLCFVLEPWQGGDAGQRLQAMPANNARLTANRVLRIRKVLQYIHDKLELGHPDRRASLSSQARRTSHDSGLITAQSSDMPPTGGKLPARFGAAEQARAAAAGKSTTSADDVHEREQGEVKAPEEVLEVLCNGVIVPISMTLAATKQYIWQAPGLAGGGSSGMDVVLQYRWRTASDHVHAG